MGEWVLEHGKSDELVSALRSRGASDFLGKNTLSHVLPGFFPPEDGAEKVRFTSFETKFPAMAFEWVPGTLGIYPNEGDGDGSYIFGTKYYLEYEWIHVYDILTKWEVDHRWTCRTLLERIEGRASVGEIVENEEDAFDLLDKWPNGVLVRNLGQFQFGRYANWLIEPAEVRSAKLIKMRDRSVYGEDLVSMVPIVARWTKAVASGNGIQFEYTQHRNGYRRFLRWI